MARILVLGANGMMGHMACRILQANHEVHGSVRGQRVSDTFAPAFEGATMHRGVESTDLDSVERVLEAVQPDVVLNCIGVIKQSDSVSDPVVTVECNALFPHLLARFCNERQIRLIHMSTDCVFSGRTGPYEEAAIPDPVDLYGRSKLLGELSPDEGLTLRTSIIGRQLCGSLSLVEWTRSERGNRVKGFTNALFSGLTTEHLARTIGAVIEHTSQLSGVYQVSVEPISKFDLVTGLNERLGLDLDIVPFDDFVIDRSLVSGRFWGELELTPPTWKTMLDDMAVDEAFYRGLALEALI